MYIVTSCFVLQLLELHGAGNKSKGKVHPTRGHEGPEVE